MTTEELLNSLPDKIDVPFGNPEDEFERFRPYGFVLDKDNGVYELSYFNFLYEQELISFNGSLHEVASKMYEWCKEKGYLNE